MEKNESIGCRIAQRLTSALCGLGIPHDQLSSIVYKECMEIAKEMEIGDWLELPNGSTFTMTFAPMLSPRNVLYPNDIP